MFDPITLSAVICAKIGWLWIEAGYSLCEEIWDHKSQILVIFQIDLIFSKMDPSFGVW